MGDLKFGVRLSVIRLTAASLAALIVAGALPSRAAGASQVRAAAATPSCPRGTTDRVDRCPEGLVSVQTAPRIDPSPFRPRVTEDVHVWLISSGVQTSALPELLRSKVQKLKSTDLDIDNVGYGTYAASVIFQLIPNAVIHSINVYTSNEGTLRNFDALTGALRSAKAAADADVVLLAFPPSDFLDPVTAMANVAGAGTAQPYETRSAWKSTLDAIGDNPGIDTATKGPFEAKFGVKGATVLGIPLDQQPWTEYDRTLSRDLLDASGRPVAAGSNRYLQAMRSKVIDWEEIEGGIHALFDAGIPVVAPSGDFGDPSDQVKGLQTIFGVASLSDVVTVGASRGSEVARTNSSGPAMGGGERRAPGTRGGLRIKPDLLAPSGLVGVLPENAILTQGLKRLTPSRIDRSLVPAWIGNVGLTPDADKTLLDTSLASAALVAVQMGAMSAEGVRSVGRQRGMLRYVTERIGDADKWEYVWRQGMGILQQSPLAVPGVADRPLVEDDGNLTSDFAADTPDEVKTRAAIHIWNGKPESVELKINQFAGLDIKGQNVERAASIVPGFTLETVKCTVDYHVSPSPSHTHSSSEEWCVVVQVSPAGNAPAGYYCGFLEMKFKDERGDQLVNAPTCFINGMSLVAHASYIAKTPASVVTFQLIPALPDINKLPVHPLTMFPVQANRTAVELYERHTNAAGDAVFPFVLPGYYEFRLMGDYGIPIDANLVPAPQNGTTSPTPSATSSGPAPTGVLPTLPIGGAAHMIPLGDGARLDASATGVENDYAPLVEDDTRSDVNDLGDNMTYFRAFSAFVLPPSLCDALSGAGCQQALSTASGQAQPDPETGTLTAGGLRFAFGRVSQTLGAALASRSIDIIPCTDLISPDATGNAWEKKCAAGDELQANFTKSLDLLGNMEYTFFTPRPTYRYRLAVNFSYRLDNAALIVEVAGGKSPPGEGLAIASSGVTIPESLAQAILKGTVPKVSGRNVFESGENKANFEFTRFLEGSMCAPCKIKFHFVPLGGVQSSGSQPIQASVRMRDLSFKMETWSKHWWPETTFAGGTKAGRSLRIVPGFDPFKIGSRCRRLPAKGEGFDGSRTGTLMCEDWTMMLHAPKNDASLKDVYYCGSAGVQVDRADPSQCEAGPSARSIFPDLKNTKSGFFVDPQKVEGSGWPLFLASHHHAFHGPISVGTDNRCDTTGRGKFWKQFVIGNRGAHQVAALPGYSPAAATLEFRFYDLDVSGASEFTELEGSVPVGYYQPLAPPSSFVIAGPGIGRLLLILGLVAAAIVAAILNFRRQSRRRRPPPAAAN